MTEKLIFQNLLREYDRCKLHRIVQEFFNVYLESEMLLHNPTTTIESHENIDRVDVLIANSVIVSSANMSSDFQKYSADVAEFLTEAGWFKQAAILFDFIREQYPGSIQATSRLIHCYVMDGEIQRAKELLNSTENEVADVAEYVQVEFLTSAALVYYAEGNFQKALRFSIHAFSRVKETEISTRAYIETLRCLSRCLAVTRNYAKALVFSELCLHISAQFEHKLADGLLTHAYCLMQDDRNNAANKFYLKAKDLREKQFGTSNNVHLATVYEELSYSCYVQKYRVGDFRVAKHFIARAMRIYNRVLPEDHLHASSAKRVLALIIEEEALDIPFQPELGIDDKILIKMKDEALEKAHLLQKESLAIAKKTFGDESVQTAKHLGNLGRLYQSMKRLKDAEELHLEAIRIKSFILGDDDPEVAVSLGHLASLYNYDIKDYQKAEDLYHRGIKICLKHHGDLYSGLEYDYTGLIHVYSNLQNERKHLEYTFILSDWKDKRKQRVQRAFTPKLDPNMKVDSLMKIIESISADF